MAEPPVVDLDELSAAAPPLLARRAWRLALAGLAIGLVLGTAGLAWDWWRTDKSWRPSTQIWPVQGAWIDPDPTSRPDRAIDWAALQHRDGARFVYLTATRGVAPADTRFADALDPARRAGLAVGAVHLYDACAAGDQQADKFALAVQSEQRMLPPAVAFDLDAASCTDLPTEAGLQSEVTIFLNRVQQVYGKAAILMPTPAFEAHFHLSVNIPRQQWWVMGDRTLPTYINQGVVLWTANLHYAGVATKAPLRWVVAVH